MPPVQRLSLMLLVTVLIGASVAQSAESARPNVLFIAVDDLNHWVGHLGRNAQTKTPNLDRLAIAGMVFNSGYAAAGNLQKYVEDLSGLLSSKNHCSVSALGL